jgi:hypothetical protein
MLILSLALAELAVVAAGLEAVVGEEFELLLVCGV